MRDMLDARKRGDSAFKDKDFKAAIDCYTQVGMCFLFMKSYLKVLPRPPDISLKCSCRERGNLVYFIYLPTMGHSNVADSSFPVFVAQFVDVGIMVSPTVFARRSLCYLMCDQPDAALRDAMQAQIVYPDWPTAFYMQAVALSKLNMQSDAVDMLNEASQLEEKRQKSTRVPWMALPAQRSGTSSIHIT